jgi:fibronectin type 3 domain-containing protein
LSRRAVFISLLAAGCGGGFPQPVQTVPLTLTFVGTGAGAVVSVPAGLDCSATCSGSYAPGIVVQLQATPAAGSVFTGWSGVCTGIDLCNVTTAAGLALTAQFDLAKAATVPGAPAAVSAVPQDQSAAVTWTQPAEGANTITSYSIVASPGGASAATASNASTATIGGLTNGTSYVFTVFAVNALGTGTGTTSAAVTPFGLPGAPLSLSGAAGDSQATLSWSPGGDNGSPIVGYRITQSPGGLVTTVASTSATVTGLTDGTTYSFAVTQVNAAGIGPAASISITPLALAGKPSAPPITGIVAQDQQLLVSWGAPSSYGGAAILDYKITASPGLTVTTVSGQVFSATLSGLTNGTLYTVTVAAENANGIGAASIASATPIAVPGTPTAFTAAPGDSSVRLSWTAPANTGGSPITGYTVARSPGTGTTTVAGTSLAVTGLVNGTTYTFTVSASNAAGTSTQAAATATPFGVPAAPPGFTATPGNGSVALSWTAPVNDGSAITGYRVTTNPGGLQTTTAGTSLTVSSLTNGTQYTFTVAAVNAGGAGPASTATATPFGPPGVPQSLTASSSDSQVALSWAAPASNGGSAITGYTVTRNPGNVVATTTSTSLNATALTNGTTYTFSIIAANATGPGAAASITATPVAAAGAPGAPANVVATPANGQVVVTWAPPASDGGSPVTGYTITQTPGPVLASAGATATSATFTGLTNGTVYTFAVNARSSAGAGPAVSATATPLTTPGVPAGFTATRGNGQVTLSWSPPSSNGGSAITGYAIAQSPGTASTASTSATSIVMTGLTNGTSYGFQVAAINAAGTGSAASATATPASAPAAPVNLTATPGDSQIALAWTAPVSGGSPITSYAITRTPGGTTSTSATSQIVAGLTNGTLYSFSVSAVNAVGTGPAAAASATPAVVPAAPKGFVAAPGNLQLSLSWTAPANGGSPITSYSLTRSPGAFATTTSSTSLAMTGLTNGTSYTVTVAAANTLGTGPVTTTAGTPCTTPDAPTGFTATRGNGQVTLAWAAPGNTGGSAIAGYTVTRNPGNVSTDAAAGATGLTVTSLTNGTLYTFAIVAVSACGVSVGASAQATPATVPGAPSITSATAGDGQVAVSWNQPASNGGNAIVNYTVTSIPGGFTAISATTSAAVTGLANGTSYTFTVHATNGAGNGPESTASAAATPASSQTAPGAPANVTATAGNGLSQVSWTAPSSGGSAITGYTVAATPASVTAQAIGTSVTVNGLTNGTSYTFKVVAANAIGSSASSASSNAVIPNPGGATTLFPLSVSANGRFLQDKNGLPFPIFGDSGWEAPHNLVPADQLTYLNDRAGKGFTAVLTAAVDHKSTASKPPQDLAGNLPFSKRLDQAAYTGSPNGCTQSGTNACGNTAQLAPDPYTNVSAQAPDLTTAGAAYWANLDSYIAAAASRGMLVFVYPMYFGFQAGDEGWSQEMVANDAVTGAGGQAGQPFADAAKSKLWNYGAWLADHYKAQGNIVWILGGDSGINGLASSGTFTAAQSNAVLHVYQGMHSVTAAQSQIWTGHWGRGTLDTDIGSDATNGSAPNGLPEPNRRYHWWEMLASGEGYFWSAGGGAQGSAAFWGFPSGWPALLQSQGLQDTARLNAFFTSLPWWTLVPSGLNGMKTLVTAGGGTASPQSTDYVSAAADAGGTLFVAYVPPAHAGNITVDLSVLAKPARVRWFNPFTAAFTAVSTNTPDTSLTLTPPGNNGSTFTDWVLVCDTP